MQQAAEVFLNKPLPAMWYLMSSKEQQAFVIENRYYAAEGLSFDAMMALITNGARKLVKKAGK